MPYFEDNPLQRLVMQAGEAEHELDLQGLPAEQAMHQVEALLAGPRQFTSCLIRFEPAADDGRETLFLPLGRRLLQARRDGLLSRCLPASDGAGYFIAFTS